MNRTSLPGVPAKTNPLEGWPGETQRTANTRTSAETVIKVVSPALPRRGKGSPCPFPLETPTGDRAGRASLPVRGATALGRTAAAQHRPYRRMEGRGLQDDRRGRGRLARRGGRSVPARRGRGRRHPRQPGL